jgi:molecular chaperone GrpE
MMVEGKWGDETAGKEVADDSSEAPDLILDLDAAGEPLLEAEAEAAAAAIGSPAAAAIGHPAAAAIAEPGVSSAGTTGVQVDRLRAEIADLRDRSLRTLADFDNYRKRADREKEEIRRYALSDFFRDFLSVADNFDLALKSGGSADDLRRGVEMIHRQFEDHLKRWGLSPVAALGQPFDPALHDAVARREDASVTTPTVAAELRRGYTLNDRLLRPAMVEVAVPAENHSQRDVEAET